MVTNVTEADFVLLGGFDPGEGLAYQLYAADHRDTYNVSISQPDTDDPTSNYWYFTVFVSPGPGDGNDTVLAREGGTFVTGSGDDLLQTDVINNSAFENLLGPSAPIRFLAGPGNDLIQPYDITAQYELMPMDAYGGSGNDTIDATDANDTLYGDTTDSIAGSGVPTIANADIAAGPVDDGNDVLNGYGGNDTIQGDGGDDQLFGGDGADSLTGGDGNDFLYGGPRGNGNLDILTGSAGSDVFLLSYNDAPSGDGAAFWAQFIGKMGQDIAGNVAKAVITDAIKDAAEGIAAGIIAAALGQVGGDLAALFVSMVENLAASGQPATPQDVMVVTDFDPREDVLILPIQNDLSGLTETVVGASVIPGGSGDADVLQFSVGSKVYAYVELSSDYLAAMGIEPAGDATKQVLANLFNFSSTIEAQNGQVGFSNLIAPAISQYLPDGGFAPQSGSLPASSSVALFGAIGGLAIHNDSAGTYTYGTVLAGTNYDDALTTNFALGAPDLMTGFSAEPSYIHGFAGDDLVYGGNAADTLLGDDGNDDLYSFYSTANSDQSINRESLSGGAGDDTLHGGGTAGDFDGGDGSDTFAVVYEAGSDPQQLEVDLTTGTAAERQAPADSSAPVGDTAPFAATVPNNYTLTSIENAIGGPLNDWIKGADGSVIEGGPGADYLNAKAGGVTISYAHSADGVSVMLGADGSVASGGDAQGDVIGYTSTSQIQALLGSPGNDFLGGYGQGGIFTFTGGGGANVFEILGVSTATIFSITDYGGPGADVIDLIPMGVTADQITIGLQFATIAAQPGGPPIATILVPNYTGILTATDFLFAAAGAADPPGQDLPGAEPPGSDSPDPSQPDHGRPDHGGWHHLGSMAARHGHWMGQGGGHDVPAPSAAECGAPEADPSAFAGWFL